MGWELGVTADGSSDVNDLPIGSNGVCSALGFGLLDLFLRRRQRSNAMATIPTMTTATTGPTITATLDFDAD